MVARACQTVHYRNFLALIIAWSLIGCRGVGERCAVGASLLSGSDIQVVLDGVDMFGSAVRPYSSITNLAGNSRRGDTGPEGGGVIHQVAVRCAPPGSGKKRYSVGGGSGHDPES